MKKPSFHDVKIRHAQHYLHVTFEASDLFDEEETQTKGLVLFDAERAQIDFALRWICQCAPSTTTDAWLIQFVDEIYAIGLLRYSISREFIPLVKQQALAARRLMLKDEEASALDSIGILFAYLGHYETAIAYFKTALGIVRQTKNHELETDIVTHLKLAQRELKEQRELVRIIQPNANERVEASPDIPDLERQLSFARSHDNLLGETTVLRELAEAYELAGNYVKAVEYQEKSLDISQNMKLHFNEIDSQINLALNYFSKPNALSDGELQEVSIFIESAEELAEEDGFAWGIDLSVLSLFLEMAPIMRQLEGVAKFLEKQGDLRARAIHKILDTINRQTSKIIQATQQTPELKLRSLLTLLQEVSQEIQKARKLLQN